VAILPYFLRRAVISLPVILLVALAVFSMVDLLPGTQVEAITGQEGLAPEQEAQLRAELGLDRPFAVRFADWATSAARLDLGESRTTNSTVLEAIGQRVAASAQLGFLSMALAVAIGVPMGIIAAVRRGGILDFVATFVAVGGVAMPTFLMAILLVLLFSVKFGWLPATGYALITDSPMDALRFSILPALTLGLHLSASLMRHTRSSMLEVLSQDYIRTAHAKGLKQRVVIVRHALRNALLPVMTILGLQFGVLITGQVVIEQVFAIPGLGRLLIDAVAARDVVLIQGTVLFVAVCLVLINLLTDVGYTIADRRARLS
jgi:peptide/nickel transport system permease protein